MLPVFPKCARLQLEGGARWNLDPIFSLSPPRDEIWNLVHFSQVCPWAPSSSNANIALHYHFPFGVFCRPKSDNLTIWQESCRLWFYMNCPVHMLSILHWHALDLILQNFIFLLTFLLTACGSQPKLFLKKNFLIFFLRRASVVLCIQNFLARPSSGQFAGRLAPL